MKKSLLGTVTAWCMQSFLDGAAIGSGVEKKTNWNKRKLNVVSYLENL